MNDKDNSDWMGDYGDCKICKGEIPYGHSSDCYIHKMQMMKRDFDATKKERDSLLTKITTLREALLRYGAHQESCQVAINIPCDCGFDEALKST